MLKDFVGEEIIGKQKRYILIEYCFFREMTLLVLLSYILTFQKYFKYFSQAGYYCSVFLWASFALWILMNITLVAVPRYYVFV